MIQIGSYKSPIKIDTERGVDIEKDAAASQIIINPKPEITPMSGTITVNFPSTAINNTSGTAFTSEISVGDGLLVDGVVYTVTNVVNNSFLFVSTSIPAISNASISKVSVSSPLIINNVDGDEVFSVNGEGDVVYSGDTKIDGDLRVEGNTLLLGTLSANAGNLSGSIIFAGTISSSATATTVSQGDNSTKVATTEYVDTAIDDMVTTNGGTENYIPVFDSTGTAIEDSIISASTSGITIDSASNSFISMKKNGIDSSYIIVDFDGSGNNDLFIIGSSGSAGIKIPKTNDGNVYFKSQYGDPQKILHESNLDEIYGQFSSLDIKDDIRYKISGFLSTNGTTAAVSGNSTAFTTELEVGGNLRLDKDGDIYVIDSITDDENLTLTTIPSEAFSNIDGYSEANKLLSATNYDGVEKFAVTQDGLKLPKFTTTEINAIASPTSGLMVYNTTLNSICFYNGTIWHVVTSGDMNAV